MIGVIDILKTDAPIIARVSTRVYPIEREEKQPLPALTVSITDIDPSDTKSGVSTLDEESIIVTSYASTFNECKLLSEECRTALDRVSGTYAGLIIQSAYFLDQFTDFEEINNKKVFFIEQNYKVRVER